MRVGTQLAVGLAIVAVGLGTFWVASTQSTSNVRMVEDLVAHPAAHQSGTWTLLGVPEPAQVAVTTSQGQALEPNPAYANATRTTTPWTRDGQTYYSTVTVTVRDDGGQLVWTMRNETRRLPADPAPAFPPEVATWTLGRSGQAFPVQAFTDEHVRVWAYYAKAPEHPMQPKPSQFTGHLLATTPDGTPLPKGVLVYEVQEYTAGCSSKFLPPAAQAKYNVTA